MHPHIATHYMPGTQTDPYTSWNTEEVSQLVKKGIQVLKNKSTDPKQQIMDDVMAQVDAKLNKVNADHAAETKRLETEKAELMAELKALKEGAAVDPKPATSNKPASKSKAKPKVKSLDALEDLEE